MSYLWNTRPILEHRAESVEGDTVARLFWNAVAMRGDLQWLREKDRGLWRGWTWNEVGTAVREIANGLLAEGLGTQETVAILSNTNIEWSLTDFAVLSCNGVTNGIYPTDAPEQVHYLSEDSCAAYLFVEDEEQLDKALQVRDRLPLLRKIIVYDMEGLRNFRDPGVMSLDDLRARGREHAAAHPGSLQLRIDATRAEDLAILVYTSGTTGRPKGAMLSNRGLINSIRGFNGILPRNSDDETMGFLPLCHIAERVFGLYMSLLSGSKISYVESPETVAENVQEISPTMFLSVPRTWEKLYSAVMMAVKDAPPIQQAAYRWAIGRGFRVVTYFLMRQPVPMILRLQYRLGRFLALDNVRKLIGVHRTRFAVIGGAPISPELIRWYLALGVPMLEGWGQTESGGIATIMSLTEPKLGSIGKAAHYNEVRVDSATGELLVRGDCVFMGYLNQPEKTAETIDQDGWLHTGDVGAADSEGNFFITDRMKDIIITAGGKNITPSEIENELKFSPYITDAVVIGERRLYLTAIILIEQENVEKFAQDNAIPFSNYASLTRAPEVRQLIQLVVDEVNNKFARVEQIKTFWLLDTQLSAEDEEMTATMKFKRKLVESKYAAQIDAMYAARN